MADEVLYLYAVADAELADAELSAVRAVDDAPVSVVAEGPVSAVVSAVDAERFSASSLRRSLEDLQWLEHIARAHNLVVSGLAQTRPVAPVRLATVFVSEDNLRSLLRDRAEEFVAALDRIRGRREWAVKGFLTPSGRSPIAELSAAVSPGRAYLERRRAEREGAERRSSQVREEAEAAHQRLAGLALANRRYPTQDRRLTGYRDEMVLNAAYLLPEGGEGELRRAVEESTAAHLRLELTGPWAPYSFATLD